ncbi:MAG: hypothetical protein AAFX40_11755 [Cyanobacteria bacterium J06639_1]
MTRLDLQPHPQRASSLHSLSSSMPSPSERLAGQLQGLASFTHVLFLKTHLVSYQHGREISAEVRSLCRRSTRDLNFAADEFARHARQLRPNALNRTTFGCQLARTSRQRTPADWLSHLSSEHHILVDMIQYALHEATQQQCDDVTALVRDRASIHHRTAREFARCTERLDQVRLTSPSPIGIESVR